MKKNLLLMLFCASLGIALGSDYKIASSETIIAPESILLLQQQNETQATLDSGAEQIIAECISRFPSEELQLSGRLTMRRRYGIEISEYNFQANVCWGIAEPYATYKFYTLKNELVDHVTIKRNTAGEITIFRNMKTPAGAQIPPPKINDAVLGSDVTWIDATMDFLWWKNPENFGKGEVKGRNCDIIKLSPPEPTKSCAYGKVWIDNAYNVLMQATQNDENDKETRRMWVRAVQKMEVAEDDERWVIKDLEVETTGSGHRTRLHFDEVKIVQ